MTTQCNSHLWLPSVSLKPEKVQNNAGHLVQSVPQTDHRFLRVLLLTVGYPLIDEYSMESLLCAMAASTGLYLSTWLNWKFTNQHAGYTPHLILPFSVFPLCTRIRLVRDLFLMLHHLSETVCLPCKSTLSNTRIFQIIKISPLQDCPPPPPHTHTPLPLKKINNFF